MNAPENRTEFSLLRTFSAVRTCTLMMWCAMCSVIVPSFAVAFCCVVKFHTEFIRMRNAILYAFCGHFYGIKCNGLLYFSFTVAKTGCQFGYGLPHTDQIRAKWKENSLDDRNSTTCCMRTPSVSRKYWKTNGLMNICTKHAQQINEIAEN